ncbi:MAG: hypothetical protein ABSF84_10525 [Acidimicrobiales bacterium]|jgi:hypothetical protein
MAEPIEDDDGDGTPAKAPSRLSRLERLLSPTAAPPPNRTTNAKGVPTKWAIDRLDGRERLYGYLSGLAAAFFAVLIYVAETNEHHPKLKKGQISPETALIVGLVSAVLLVGSTRIGRRALVGFVALFTFLGFANSSPVIGLPFLVLAGWLLFRSYKVQKEATAKIRADREAGITAADARPGRTPRSAAASGRTAAEARSARKKGPPVPEANKRYTPKKPPPRTPPPPKPSWRERRAARTSD